MNIYPPNPNGISHHHHTHKEKFSLRLKIFLNSHHVLTLGASSWNRTPFIDPVDASIRGYRTVSLLFLETEWDRFKVEGRGQRPAVVASDKWINILIVAVVTILPLLSAVTEHARDEQHKHEAAHDADAGYPVATSRLLSSDYWLSDGSLGSTAPFSVGEVESKGKKVGSLDGQGVIGLALEPVLGFIRARTSPSPGD